MSARFRVVVTARAYQAIVRADAWWRDNRSAAPDRFLDELEAALDSIAHAPHSGAGYPSKRVAGCAAGSCRSRGITWTTPWMTRDGR